VVVKLRVDKLYAEHCREYVHLCFVFANETNYRLVRIMFSSGLSQQLVQSIPTHIHSTYIIEDLKEEKGIEKVMLLTHTYVYAFGL